MAYDETIVAGTTSKIIEVMLRDSSTGLGKTGLTFSDVVAYYCREGATATAITLVAGSPGDAYSSGKWAEVDATNMRGLYQLHIPDAALATGVKAVTITLQASGAIDSRVRVCLPAVDAYDAVRAGLAALPNAAADAAGGLPISDAGGLDLDTILDVAISTRNAVTPLDAAGVRAAVGLASANLDTQLDDIPTVAEFEARTLVASAYFDPTNDVVAHVTLVDITTTNSDMRGTDNAALAATALSNTTWTDARAGYLDNIDGHVAQTGDTYALANGANGFAAIKTDTGDLVSRITATLFSGITSLAQWLGLIAGKQTGDATALTELRATGAGSGTYDPTTDANEAIRDVAPHGTVMRGTDNALLSASVPANFSSLVISSAGAVDALVQGFLDTTVIETSAGRIAGNFEVFWDDADALTTKTVDDVGATDSGLTAAQVWAYASRTLTDFNHTVRLADGPHGGPSASLVLSDYTHFQGAGGGDGSVFVNHDYGGTDVLAYKTAGGAGIDNAVIKAYLKTDYDAGHTSQSYVVAETTTDVNGRFNRAFMLDPAVYTFLYYKQGAYGPDTKEVTVS